MPEYTNDEYISPKPISSRENPPKDRPKYFVPRPKQSNPSREDESDSTYVRYR